MPPLHREAQEALASGDWDAAVEYWKTLYTDEGATFDAEVVEQIKELLDTRVRPAVAQDGGDILFDTFDEETGVLSLRMRGACAGCPSSSATLKAGVEQMMRHYVPEVTRVEQVF